MGTEPKIEESRRELTSSVGLTEVWLVFWFLIWPLPATARGKKEAQSVRPLLPCFEARPETLGLVLFHSQPLPDLLLKETSHACLPRCPEAPQCPSPLPPGLHMPSQCSLPPLRMPVPVKPTCPQPGGRLHGNPGVQAIEGGSLSPI